MTKKFELSNTETKTLPNGTVLRRIVALRNGPWGPAGTVGGWVEEESNLSQGDDDSWIYDEAKCFNKASIRDGWSISGTVECYGLAISGLATIKDDGLPEIEKEKESKDSYIDPEFDLLKNLW